MALQRGCLALGWGPEPDPGPGPGPGPGPDPEPCPVASEWAEARVENAPGGGIDSVTLSVTSSECAGSSLWLYQDCCSGPVVGIERVLADGSTEPVPVGVDCLCGGTIEPTEIAPGGTWETPVWAWWFPEDGAYRFVLWTSSALACPSPEEPMCVWETEWNELRTFTFAVDVAG